SIVTGILNEPLLGPVYTGVDRGAGVKVGVIVIVGVDGNEVENLDPGLVSSRIGVGVGEVIIFSTDRVIGVNTGDTFRPGVGPGGKENGVEIVAVGVAVRSGDNAGEPDTDPASTNGGVADTVVVS